MLTVQKMVPVVKYLMTPHFQFLLLLKHSLPWCSNIFFCRVSKDDSLFKADVKSTAAWVHPACTCYVKSDEFTSEQKCQLGADNSCSKGRTVGKQTCKKAEKTNIGTNDEKVIPTLDLNTKSNHSFSVTVSGIHPEVNLSFLYDIRLNNMRQWNLRPKILEDLITSLI